MNSSSVYNMVLAYLSFHSKLICNLQFSKLKGKLKAMFRICRYCKGLLFETLDFSITNNSKSGQWKNCLSNQEDIALKHQYVSCYLVPNPYYLSCNEKLLNIHVHLQVWSADIFNHLWYLHPTLVSTTRVLSGRLQQVFLPASQGSVQLWSSAPLELWEALCQPYWNLSSSQQSDTLALRLARSNSLCLILCHPGKACCLWECTLVNTLSFKQRKRKRLISYNYKQRMTEAHQAQEIIWLVWYRIFFTQK